MGVKIDCTVATIRAPCAQGHRGSRAWNRTLKSLRSTLIDSNPTFYP